jgi:formate dehydrogenase major subunit
MALNCKGEELDGVTGGIDFLRAVAEGNAPDIKGLNVAVVGGGNTAMDACRTAVRLGASKVYNIYRRTKNEMPAEQIEIEEAEEESVVFKNLTNPNEVVGENGKVKAIRLQIMALGEPDASGRRAPVPVEGREETLAVDVIVVAIGQSLEPAGLDGIELTRRKTIEADEISFLTNVDGVFAIGDATNKGASIAVEAIGEAQRASDMICKYLNGEALIKGGEYFVKTEPEAEDFAGREKLPRAKMPRREAQARAKDFKEVNLGLSDEAAKREAGRCLECGCLDYYDCKLVELAGKYAAAPQRYAGAKHARPVAEDDHPQIRRNPDKCVLCGLCVRICDEVAEKSALGLVNRGFETVVMPALGVKLKDTECDACGLCVNVCPTGAITEIFPCDKQVPFKGRKQAGYLPHTKAE